MRHDYIGFPAPPSSAASARHFPSGRSARACRELIDARARRARFFNASLFAEPAWDILLELFAAEAEGRRLSATKVGLSANIPLTTVLRAIAVLLREGLVDQKEDPVDGRRKFLMLSDKGFQAMQAYVDRDRAPC